VGDWKSTFKFGWALLVAHNVILDTVTVKDNDGCVWALVSVHEPEKVANKASKSP
jgi:hypothetical protein